MNRPLKIAIYTGKVPSSTFIERLIFGLAQKEFEVYLFGLQENRVSSSSKIKYITYANKFSKLLQLFKYTILLTLLKAKDKKRLDTIIYNSDKNSRLLKVKYYPVLYHSPDIFHIQWAKSVEEWIWVKDFGMKLIVSLRGTHITISPIGNIYWKDIYSKYFPDIDGFHSVSKSMAIEAEKFGANLSKVKVIHSGLDINSFPFHSKTNKSNLIKIISVGRSHWVKGYDYALKAMKLLSEQGAEYHYNIVGVENNEELLFLRSDLKLKRNVTFIKPSPIKEVKKLIQEADVLLLPSVEEGIANVVLESMALGTIVVSTNCGGMSEVLKDNKNGFLIPIRDSISMAAALFKVSELSIQSYNKITSAARKTIEKQHGTEKMLEDMNTLYQKVLNNKL